MIDLCPVFQIKADGGAFAMDRVLSVEITDEAGFESDELVITLDDADPQIARPRDGAKFQVSLGYAGASLIDFGTYVFQEIERSGWPRILKLTAKAADHASTLKEPKTRAWEATTLGAIVRKVAGEHGLAAVVSDRMGSLAVPYLAQTEESDQNLLTRVAKRVGAVITPKDGRLVVTERHSGKSASGQAMPAVAITKGMLMTQSGYKGGTAARGRHKEVKAKWRDRGAGSTKEVKVQTGLEGPSMTLREVFQSEGEAKRAAEAAARKAKSGNGEITLTLVGNPALRAEAPITVSGVSLDIDGSWVTSSVRHIWDFKAGATTELTADLGADSAGI